MPRDRKAKGQASDSVAETKTDGRTVCALCAHTISQGDENQPVIYSICLSCKRSPHSDAGISAR
jgi:hypothetical protein